MNCGSFLKADWCLWISAACLVGCSHQQPGSVAALSTAPAPAALAVVAPEPVLPVDGRLPDVVVPMGYELSLRVDPRKTGFSGEVTIALDVRRRTSQLYLHAVDMQFSRVVAEQAGAQISASADIPGADGLRRLRLQRPLSPGKAQLTVSYTSPFDKHLAGLYRARHGERWYAYTQFEAADARKAFPCFDEPGFKVSFRTTVTVPTGMLAVSNSPEARRTTRDGWTTFHFAPTRPLPTYLVALVVGEAEIVSEPKSTVPLRAIVPVGKGALAREALRITAELLPLFERYFGVPYPYRKLDLAAAVEFGSGAMENAGLITFREEALLLDPKTVSQDRRRRVVATIAHELAHQWFGNLVTMAWWDDLWLNEAFATWMGTKIVDQWQPELGERAQLMRWRDWVFGVDALAAARPVRQRIRTVAEAEGAFDGLTYAKGASVLSMLEQWLGADGFRRGLRAYMKRHAWGNATAADLFAALSGASGQPVADVAGSFVDRPGLPMVKAELLCQAGRATVTLTQQRYRPLGARSPAGFPDGGPWKIPVCIAYPQGKELQRSCTLLDVAHQQLELPQSAGCPEWIYPNADDSGYFHWAVSSTMLQKLVSNRRRLPSSSRRSLIEKGWAMVAAGASEPSALMRLLWVMRDSTDRHVLEQMVAALEHLSHVWVGADAEASFQRFSARLLRPIVHRLGLKSSRNDSQDKRLARVAILNAAGRYARLPEVARRAKKLAGAYFHRTDSVSPELATHAIQVAAHEGVVSVDQLTLLLKGARTPSERINALKGLAAMAAGRPLDRALSLLLDGTVRAQDIDYLLRPAFKRSETRHQAMAFLRQHFAALTKRMPAFGWRSVARLPRILEHFCSEKHKRAAESFLVAQRIRGANRSLEQGAEFAEQCIALRRAGQQTFNAHLRGAAASQ